jgi:hypothetical protein
MARKYTNITDLSYSDETLKRRDESDRKYIYLNGVLDFFKVIDWSKNTLTLYGVPDNVDVFEALDSVDAQVKGVSFSMCISGAIIKYISQSNQSKYIEKLDILNTSIDSIHLIKNMTALTTLWISFYNSNCPPLNLASCLYACLPSLKTLSIECGEVIVEPFTKKLTRLKPYTLALLHLPAVLRKSFHLVFPTYFN